MTDKLKALLKAHRKVGRREEWFNGGEDLALCACGAETRNAADSFEGHVAEAIRQSYALVELDRAADAGYLTLTTKPVQKTVGVGLSPSINVDLDAEGGVVGIELMSISAGHFNPAVGD